MTAVVFLLFRYYLIFQLVVNLIYSVFHAIPSLIHPVHYRHCLRCRRRRVTVILFGFFYFIKTL